MYSIHAWFQNGDFAGADTYLNAVDDQTIFTQGKLMRVPPGRNFLLGEAWATAAATRNYARLETPSLRTLVNQYLPNGSNSSTPVDTLFSYHPYSPRELAVAEQAQFLVNTDDAAAQDHVAIVLLGDGAAQPVTSPKMFTARATAAITQAAGVWRQGTLTFQDVLPYGTYQVVGIRIQAATGHAGRLIFTNSEYRPGCLAAANNSVTDLLLFRYGKLGVVGSFELNQPPQLEMLGGTATAQTVYLDLIKTN